MAPSPLFEARSLLLSAGSSHVPIPLLSPPPPILVNDDLDPIPRFWKLTSAGYPIKATCTPLPGELSPTCILLRVSPQRDDQKICSSRVSLFDIAMQKASHYLQVLFGVGFDVTCKHRTRMAFVCTHVQPRCFSLRCFFTPPRPIERQSLKSPITLLQFSTLPYIWNALV